MYQHDPFLDDLLRRPMQMAANNDQLEDFDEDEDEDDLFGADLLAAAEQEREEEQREAAEFAASLLGQDAEPEAAVEEAAEAAPPEPPKLFTRPGIRRNLIGYALLTLFGLVPVVLLFIFGSAAGLNPVMALFSIALVAGLGFSIYNLVYSFQHGYEFTVSFNIRSFFKLWPECAVISAVLILISFWNLSQLDSGRALTLSGKSLASAPAAGRSLTESVGSEHEEKVIYSSFRTAYAPRRARVAPARRGYNKYAYRRQAVKPAYGKVAVAGKTAAHGTPAAAGHAAAPAAHAAAATTAVAATAATHAAPAHGTAAAGHETAAHAAPAAGHEATAATHEAAPAHDATAASHDAPSHETAAASGGSTASGSSAEALLRNASNASGGAVGVVGARMDVGDRVNQLMGSPVGGAGVGLVGSLGDKLDSTLALRPKPRNADVLGSDNPTVNTFFLGGPLCAAFGYALLLGIAGAIFGALRKFETPFSQKYVEILNIETGEVTSDLRPIAPIMKPLNIAARILIGLFYGSTLGFALGIFLILPLFILFRGSLITPGAPSAVILQALGVSNLPDLAFSNAVTVGGLMIPLVMLVVAKMSPQGMSISEELMRQHYEIKPTGKFVPADQAIALTNPAAVSFGIGEIPEDELERELGNTKLMNELVHDDDNLTTEIIEEFGREFETVFGIDTRELISQPRGKQTVDRKRLATALDESFGELGNVPVEISAELGSANLPITEWLNLREGTLVLLDKPANEEIDILFNGVRKGKGKLVVSDNALSVKVSTTNFQGGDGNGSRLV